MGVRVRVCSVQRVLGFRVEGLGGEGSGFRVYAFQLGV